LSLGPGSPSLSAQKRLQVALIVLLTVTPLFSQKSQPSSNGSPKYDAQTEMKTKGTVDEIKTFSLGNRKDYTELIIKSGADSLQIYLSPKPFQDEMGISFAKGDEVAVTGSKIKQEEADVILAREIIKGTDTFMFRDDKGKPVWDERTGK
jgi:uncharacterized protein YdeI (BOF family)